MSILDSSVSHNDIVLYELYIQRVQKENDLIWSRFKIYFGFNSGLLVIIGYLLNPYFTEECFNCPDYILWLIFFLGWIGMLFAITWLSVNINGHKWQDFFNDMAKEVEKKLFDNLDYALYHRLLEDGIKKKSFFDVDVVEINEYLSKGFIIIWGLIIVLSFTFIVK